MKIRHHQFVDLIVVTFFTVACVQSILFNNGVLHRLSLASMYMLISSIIVGIILGIYIHYTNNQIFDPLDSELDSDPDDIEKEEKE